MVDLGLLESVFLLAMGGWLIVLGGAFLLSRRRIDRASALLLVLAGVYAILWQQPTILGFGEAFHVALAQPVFLSLLSGAIFLWTYWLFEQHVERLQQALSGLEDSLSLERTLVDVLSHDLQNPMAAASLDVQQMAREHPEFQERLDRIERKIQRASDVMENGVVYSRLASQSDTPPMTTLDLVEQVEDAVEDARRHAEEKGVQLEIRAPEALPIEASPLIERAVGNLVDNAVEHSPHEGTVAVAVEGGPDSAVISVADEGPGISPEDRERLLERFARNSDDDDGNGLGLAIVRRLVEIHEGRLDIRDSPAGGALIEIEIPRSPPGEPGSPPTRPSPQHHPGGEHPS